MSGVQGDLFGDEPWPDAPAAQRPGAVQQSIVERPIAAAELLDTMDTWARAGWLRRLDSAFGRFLFELDPQASPLVLWAASLVAHMEGQGHACLELETLQEPLESWLGWKPEGLEEARAVWARSLVGAPACRKALAASPLVECVSRLDEEHGHVDARPLVLFDDKLYLRRYWRYERRVAQDVMARVAESSDASVAGQTAAKNGGSTDDPAWRSKVRGLLDLLFGAAKLDGASAPDRASPASRALSQDEMPPHDALTPASGAVRSEEPDWQRVACAVALRGRLSIITGGPGTGKTYTVARLIALLLAMAPDPERLRVALAAPTGKAAARLRQSIDTALNDLVGKIGDVLPLRELAQRMGAARTLHSLLGARGDTRHFRHGRANPLDVDILVVDEASMVHLEMMQSLLAALPPGARVILLGDKDQLASVEAGAVLGDLCRQADAGSYARETRQFVAECSGVDIGDRYGVPAGVSAPLLAQQTVMLRVSRRFSGAIGDLARAVNAGDAARAAQVLHGDPTGDVAWVDKGDAAAVVALALNGRAGKDGGVASGSYRHYLQLVAGQSEGQRSDAAEHADWVAQVLRAFDRFRVLCAVREGSLGVAGLNEAIEKALAEAGLLKRSGPWYEGRPVLVTRNDYAAGVFNGDVGIALKPPGEGAHLRVYFQDGDALRSVMASRLADVETSFAMTVHKSQGSEFEHTVLALPADASRVLTRELVYTGITRARQAFTLVTPEGDAFERALAQRTRRASGLPALLAAEESRHRRS